MHECTITLPLYQTYHHKLQINIHLGNESFEVDEDVYDSTKHGK